MIIDPDFADHWKTRVLVDLLGADEAAPVYLIRLWAHCQLRRAWVFNGVTPAALKAICRYQGDAGAFDAAMVESGFVSRDATGTLTVVGWDEYNASLIANWNNGKRGGRPLKAKKPIDNPEETHGLSMGSPQETQGVTRSEPIREDEIGGEPTNSRHLITSALAPVDNSEATTTEDDLDDHQTPQTEGLPLAVPVEWFRRHKVTIDVDNPLIKQWARDGVTEQQFESAIAKAKRYKPESIPANYLGTIIEELMTAPERARPRLVVGTTLESVTAAARAIGLGDGRIGETVSQLRQRVLEAMDSEREVA